MILLDTNVLSEALRPSPDARVVAWLDANFPESALSSISIFELRAGVAMLPDGKRRDALGVTIARMLRRFGGRVFSFDAMAAQAAAQVLETARRRGSPLHQVPTKLADLQIAGIASAYALQLATRNVSDFEGTGLTLINPWAA